jgi:hypothetical protein
MIDVIYHGHTYEVPENWDELSGSTFVQIVTILLGKYSDKQAEIMLLAALLGVPVKMLLRLPAEQLAGIVHLTRWIDSEMNITGQLFRYIKAPGKLYGPAGGFDNMTAVEFHFVEHYYHAWKRTGDDTDLYSFISVMYRPAKKKYDIVKNPDGDVREPFNQNLTGHYASKIKKLSRELLLCIVFQYEAWRRTMENDYKEVFGKKGGDITIDAGWFGVFRGVASEGKFGPLDKVELLNIHTLMLELKFLDAEDKALKKKYPEYFKN